MVGHISYLSEKGMQEKFGRKLQEKADYEFSFNADFFETDAALFCPFFLETSFLFLITFYRLLE